MPVSDPSLIDTARYRAVLSQFCTGVTVITTMDDGVPVGFACQSFAALSLDPPLVVFCPTRQSRAWAAIERSGRFCVNVLAEAQRDVSSTFGSRGEDKFAGIDWTASPAGSPLLAGTLTWIDCTVHAVHEAGDHYMVVGKVLGLGEPQKDPPLLFYRGAYTSTAPEETMPVLKELEDFLTYSKDQWL